MKKSIYLALLTALVVMSGCHQESDQISDSELDQFLHSEQYTVFKTNFEKYNANLNFDNVVETDLGNGETLYQLSTKLVGLEVGVLNVIISDNQFKSFFELRTFNSDLSKATVSFYGLDGVEQFSMVGRKLNNSDLYELSFSSKSTSGRINSCIGDCYKTASDACDGDGDCKLLCDLLDIVGYCTASLASACFGHCYF
ncbi:hypothetical protein [Fulvivirga imtechensis]|nr:hypothetical protein [Fulvivirga imtechensis]